ncbi:tetratricopeptide repeat protein [Nonomuraea sediminis]|uniref:tetratricopeptide repeat protein n=1 Tax=Nonomuraea sediminis TaxID=2835864 RepID=UPI001BDD7AD8|nr:tetratricopeptide repeat protein [Nonomuraea sediminis]
MKVLNPKALVNTISKRGRRTRRALTARRRATEARRNPEDARRWAKLGRALERRKDWQAAGEAYSAALRLRPDSAVYHGKLARVAKVQGAWQDVIAHLRRALELQPGKYVWVRALGRCLAQGGELAEAIDIHDLDRLEVSLARAKDRTRVLKVIAKVAESLGQWQRASEALQEMIDGAPHEHEWRYRLAHSLERLYSVPFTFGADGVVSVNHAPEAAFDRAVTHFSYLVEHHPRRVHAVHRLGGLHEAHGDLEAAAEAYRLAVQRLEEIDATWTHMALQNWRFRLAYVTRQSDDVRIGRTVTPDLDTVAPPTTTRGGFFEAHITATGLRISGYLAPGTRESVAIHVGGRVLKRITVDAGPWLPTFSYELTHDVMGQFDERTELELTVEGRHLVTTANATTVRVHVPGGNGKLPELLAEGRVPTKWGGWPPSESEQVARLLVYVRAKEILERHFGKHLFLFYGTLLGHHRDQGFIPGDDDFDCAYLADSTRPKDLKVELQETSLRLMELGLDICFAGNGRMIKVGLNGMWIDVIPVWFHRGRAWSFDAHELRKEDFEPVVPATFMDREVYVPRDTEAFLVDNYGPGWRTPRSDFRYYQDKNDRKLLATTWLTPSEVREFAERAERVRAGSPSAGRFAGLELPGGEPGFR